MGNRWYYKWSHQVIGPISFAGLRRMALERGITRETLVREGTDGPWIRAGEVEALYAPVRNLA